MAKSTFFRPWMGWVLAGLVAFLSGLHVRLYPLYHNVASDAYEQGTLLVINQIRTTLAAQIKAQYPNLPAEEKTRMLNAKLNELLHNNSEKIRKAFDKVGDEISRKAKEPKHYLQESDSYYFLNLTENILEKGDVSDQVKGSRYFNHLMLAPLGFWEPQTWHPYVGAAIYRAVHWLNPDTTLMEGVAWTPIVLLGCVIAAFLFTCAAMGCSWTTSLIASVFFVLSPIYLKRSTWAWYGHESYNVLFPLLGLGLFFLAVKHIGMKRRGIVYGVLCCLVMSLYAMFWAGWGFLWALLTVAAVAMTVRAWVLKEQRAQSLLALTGTLILLTFVAVACLYTWPLVFDTIKAAWGELRKFTMPSLTGWPDLFISVGELKRTTAPEIVYQTGGPLVALGTAAAVGFAVRDFAKEKKWPGDEILTLAILAAATFILSLGALRFTLLCAPPMALLFALGLERLRRHALAWIEATAAGRIPAGVGAAIVSVLLFALILIPTHTASTTVRSLLNPIFNSAWERALVKLRDKSPPESIVNTWWSPGHFVKAIAQRRVTFDGATIRGEQGYWLTQVYLAQSEREALGVLRMLNTSSNKAVEYLQDQHYPLSTAVPLVKAVTATDRESAQKNLLKILPPKNVDELLSLTHGERATPPPSYVLLYNENMEGNVLLGYVGKWDFAKIEALNENRAALKKIPGKSSPEYIDFLWSLVGGPYKQSPELNLVAKKGSRLLFDNGVTVDTADMSAFTGTFGQGVPVSIVYFDDAKGEVLEKTLRNATLGVSVVLYEDHDEPKAQVMDRELANSLIVKMYYFQGRGLKYFKPFASERDLTGRTKIFIYEIAWPKEF